MQEYNASLKQEIVVEGKSLQSDRFNSWLIINKGTSTIIVNDVIPIAPGAQFGVGLQPYETYVDDIYISFKEEVGTENKAIVIKQYATKK